MRDRKEYNKKYYLEHKKEANERSNKWNLSHKIEKFEYDKQRRLDHPEYDKAYRLTHKKEITEYNKEYRLNNKELIVKTNRQFRLKKAYGLSLKDWEGLWYAQDGRCAICDEFFTNVRSICVDHDHKTGKVRGLLCRNCNYGLGYFNDNIELLVKAICFLKNKK